MITAPIFASFRYSWPRDVRLLSSSASILIARIPFAFVANGQACVKFEAVLRLARAASAVVVDMAFSLHPTGDPRRNL